MRPYVDYSDRDIPFVDSLPTHWEIKPLYVLCDFQQGKAHEPYVDDDGQYICVNSRYVSTAGAKVKFCTENLTPARIDDVLMVMSDLPNGRALAKGYYVSSDKSYAVNQRVCAISAKGVDARFLFYQLDRNIHFLSLDDGANQTHLSNSDFLKFPVLLPTSKEQRAIASFLDHETAKIDTLIEKQQQLIKLLKEKRQAMISHAVTKGLNPDAPMKGSGVEWLGEVPEGWLQPQLGQISLSKCDGPFGSGLKSEHYVDKGALVVRLQNIKLGWYESGVGAFIDEQYFKNTLSKHSVVEGDLLVAGLGDPRNPVGRACVAPNGIAPALVKADCFRFTLDVDKVEPEFVAAQLSVSSWADAGSLANGSTRARIPLYTMSTRTVAFGTLEEQRAIVQELSRINESFTSLSSKSLEAIALLQERRTALISAAVTGKIDVRNWQPPKSDSTTSTDA